MFPKKRTVLLCDCLNKVKDQLQRKLLEKGWNQVAFEDVRYAMDILYIQLDVTNKFTNVRQASKKPWITSCPWVSNFQIMLYLHAQVLKLINNSCLSSDRALAHGAREHEKSLVRQEKSTSPGHPDRAFFFWLIYLKTFKQYINYMLHFILHQIAMMPKYGHQDLVIRHRYTEYCRILTDYSHDFG